MTYDVSLPQVKWEVAINYSWKVVFEAFRENEKTIFEFEERLFNAQQVEIFDVQSLVLFGSFESFKLIWTYMKI